MSEEVKAAGPSVKFQQLTPWLWEIPADAGMHVPGRIYASRTLMKVIESDKSAEQVANVAYLPGIVGYSIAMPDIHWGYGFPIGCVAATDIDQGGVISPGGVGYDINCGVRVVRTDLTEADVKPRIDGLLRTLFDAIPCGTGAGSGLGRDATPAEMQSILSRGAAWAVQHGYGTQDDLVRCEESGCLQNADPNAVSERALARGARQVGSLGSGNHFLEIDVVDEIYDPGVAEAFGLQLGAIAVQIHCGSRGLGHQVCDDSLDLMQRAVKSYGIRIPDRQLCCVPVTSPEGRSYLGAMGAAANFAWANRQIIMEIARRVFKAFLGVSEPALGWRLVYDVCHNIAKIEAHQVGTETRRLCVHRKGATRAFPRGHPDVPEPYRAVGQPVLVPGDMGTCSYICCGEPAAMEQTFGTSCHGAGRVMSRSLAIKHGRGRKIDHELAQRGIAVRARSRGTLAEEMSDAYKDVADVVEVVHMAGIVRKVARLRPIGVIKG